MRIKLTVGAAMLLVALGTAAPAWAVDPTPPADPAAVANSAIANFGDKAISVFTALVSQPWVLAIFAFGIAVAFARGVIHRVRSKVQHGIG
jgi:hypothetical protein